MRLYDRGTYHHDYYCHYDTDMKTCIDGACYNLGDDVNCKHNPDHDSIARKKTDHEDYCLRWASIYASRGRLDLADYWHRKAERYSP
jgi:hypothetical protein